MNASAGEMTREQGNNERVQTNNSIALAAKNDYCLM